MWNKEFLLEVGCEEIPSRFVLRAVEQLQEQAGAMLSGERLSYGEIEGWGTPRRLVLFIKGLEQRQPDLVEKIKGPPVNRAYDSEGAPTQALLGFLRTQDVALEQVEVEKIKGAEYVVVHKETAGRSTEDILGELLPGLLRRLNFPKPMFWHSKEIRFARPIRWLLALYGADTIPFTFAGITAGRMTYGHRFLNPGPHSADSPEGYFRCLQESGVVLDHHQRREIIRSQVAEAAVAQGGQALIKEELLDEVTFLVENPVAVAGSFHKDYLKLPREVLSTTMQVHQRYFPVEAQEGGKLLPCFIGISNNSYHDNIRKGYEKVLQARLADARFFFNEDRKQPLESYVKQLADIIYMEALGSIDQKRQRLLQLVKVLGVRLKLSEEVIKGAERAAHLCKADLVTNMVGEFPELQGIMGREYALSSGEGKEVAAAVYEHYLPRHAGDSLPESLEGALLSLSDRTDTLVGCFAAGIRPTGSQDPYGLRRQAQGIVSILLKFELDISPMELVAAGLNALKSVIEPGPEEHSRLLKSLSELFIQRLRFALQEKGSSYDVIEAVLSVPYKSIPKLFRRGELLETHLRSPLLENVVTAYNRAANLARKAPKGSVNPALLQEPSEKELYRRLQETAPKFDYEFQYGSLHNCLQQLQSLKAPLDTFFDEVLVMAEDEQIKENRLRLLARVAELFQRLADFSQLQSG